MRKKIIYLILLFSALQYGCERSKKQQSISGYNTPKVVKARGYMVPPDSLAPPEVVPLKNVKAITAGKPKIINIRSNIYPIGTPKVTQAGTPRICTPGQDTFKLPKVMPAIDSSFIGGLPEVVVVTDPLIKDNNPGSFSSFKILQGLKSENIFPMIQDKAGNLWIGCWEGGVSKYDGRLFTHYTTSQGLSNDHVWSMQEDSKGNLWFGTLKDGLNKYDGKSFTHFTTGQGLSDSSVISICEDNKGNLWFGTEHGGVNKYDGKSFTHYTTAQGLVGNHVHDIMEDSNGDVWFGTSGGLSKFDGKSFSNFATDHGLNNDVTCMLEDRSGNLWLGMMGGGVSKFDGKFFTNYTTAQGLSSNKVFGILEDKSGNLWICTIDKGVNRFDGKSFTPFGIDQGLTSNSIHSIVEDKSGNLWFGTDGGGVCKYDGRSFTHLNTNQGLTEGNINCILEDKAGNLWVGTSPGGLSRYDGKSFTHYTIAQGLHTNNVQYLLEDRNGNIWIAMWGGGLDKYDGKSFTHYSFGQGLSSDLIGFILEDKKENLWFSTELSGVYKYDGKSFTNYTTAQGLSSNDVYTMLEDKTGNIWFGTRDRGINKFDGQTFTRYSASQGLSDETIFSIAEDKHGNLWFGTGNGGVNKYDGKSFTHYTTDVGISDNKVTSILEDKNGDMWFGTINGLSRMQFHREENTEKVPGTGSQPGTPLFKNYLFSDGFLGVGTTYAHSLIQDRNGNIWAGTTGRLTCHHPEGDIPDTIPPQIQLTGISLFNQNINWPNVEKKKDSILLLSNGVTIHDIQFNELSKWYYIPQDLKLAYDNNYLSFQFVGITINRSRHVKYQYFLDGLDKNWSSITDKPEASYSDLPQGKYTFKVKAVNSEGYWSNEFAYHFTILPPWWGTWWAYVLYIMIFLVSLWSFIKLRESALKKEKVLLEEKVAIRTHELQEEKEKIDVALIELQATQAQLIQSEKIASLSKLQQAMLNERLRISRELHDDIGSTLSGIVLYSHLAESQIQAQHTDEVEQSLNVIQQSANDMVNRLSDIVWSVNPEHESLKKFIQKLEEYAKEMARVKNIRVQATAPGSLAELQLPVENRHNIYLFCKEAINNAVKYSNASLLELSVNHFDNIIEFTIRDNGKGFDRATVKKGNGLINMQKRADEVAAIFSMQSVPHQGTIISLQYKIT